ncbi:MAG: hypothetical protein M3Y87_21180 [Myxococcota bacterium]|nr:hypothetical protein [Myxococcota bacterium]
MRFVRLALASLVLSVSLSLLVGTPARAQERPGRSALELSFDHGVSQLREPGEQVEWTGAHAALDVRLHSPSGFGGLVRVGTTLGKTLALELDAGAAYRAWVHRRGPRGLQLGGGIGASMFWNALAPSVGIDTALATGAFFTAQLDYREHGFFVGIGYHARWLPLRGVGGDLDTFSFSAMVRVGGEITL